MYDKNDKDKNFLWTTDYKVELPIIRKSEGWGCKNAILFLILKWCK